MPSLQLYDVLLRLPLFLGLSRADLAEIVAQTRFGFQKATAGDIIVREGELCACLYLLTNGRMNVVSYSHNRNYSIAEDISAPTVLQPERMFGLTQRYTKTFSAAGNCNFLTLDKNEVMRLSDSFMIFRLNFLNLVSAVAQKRSVTPWRNTPMSVRDRIIRFVETRCLRPVGEKHLKIRMEDLAREVCDSRLNVSKALNAMQGEGLLSLSRGMIHIPQMEMMIHMCNIR